MQWSFSRANSFENCPYAWALGYIECADKEGNFFSDYGLLIHETLEKFFKSELEVYELAQWYEDHYDEFIKNPCPPFPVGMEEQYRNSGLDFFENFDFPKDDYEVLGIEDSFNIKMGEYDVIIKPDLFLRHKATGKYILYDYKSSVLFREATSRTPKDQTVYLSKDGVKEPYTFKSKDKREQLVEYVRQMYIYCHGLKEHYNIDISEIRLWFIRQNRELAFPYKPEKSAEAIEWFLEEIQTIRDEEDFKPITFGLDEKELKQKAFWCNYLCGVRGICPYRATTGE
jgi:hypothetical protein